jgi:hypothetical protein
MRAEDSSDVGPLYTSPRHFRKERCFRRKVRFLQPLGMTPDQFTYFAIGCFVGSFGLGAFLLFAMLRLRRKRKQSHRRGIKRRRKSDTAIGSAQSPSA